MNRKDPAKYKRGRITMAILVALFANVGVGLLSACRQDAGSTESGIQLAPASQLSERVRGAPPVVQEAYRFAIANPEILAKLPCYCGCNQVGHENNRMCYVQSETADGQVVFDSHALG